MFDMKTEDFERLKAVCEKEGYILEPHNDRYFIITPKDIWDGVEFVLDTFNGNILRVDSLKLKPSPMVFKASTESDYTDQLKKEAFERFGEIKEGDRFDLTPISPNSSDNWATYPNKPDFEYTKDIDRLLAKGITIYQSGKWATRVKERVRVDPKSADSIRKALHKGFDTDYNEFREFLASQLEEYLNK